MSPDALAYRVQDGLYRVRRRAAMGRIDRVYRDLIATWDQEAFCNRFRRFWSPFPTTRPAKFLDLDLWLREAILRYELSSGIPERQGPQRVVDLGAGTGYFLLVCRHFGHEVLGVDLDEEPLYNECFEFFRLPRKVFRIEPRQPVADLGARVDVITAFMTAFNIHPDGSPWGPDEWVFLLNDLRTRLRDDGRIVIQFNVNKRTRSFYSPEVRRAIEELPGLEAHFARDYLVLEAR